MTLPIAKVVLPKDLKGQANGLLRGVLTAIPGGQLHHLAAQAWLALCAKAKAEKIVLEPTSPVDTYRPFHVQEETFFKRYDNTKRNTRHEVYQGRDWWLKLGVAGCAVPGTSNHGYGIAIDIAHVDNTKLAWLLRNASVFGFSWEDQSENWHIRYVTGDKVPVAVTAWLQGKK